MKTVFLTSERPHSQRAGAIASKFIEDRAYLQAFGKELRARDAEQREAAGFLKRKLAYARGLRDSPRWLSETGVRARTKAEVDAEAREDLSRMVEMTRALRTKAARAEALVEAVK